MPLYRLLFDIVKDMGQLTTGGAYHFIPFTEDLSEVMLKGLQGRWRIS